MPKSAKNPYTGGIVSTGIPTTDTDDNKYWQVSLGAEYKLADGVAPFAEITRFKFNESGATKNNKGYIFLSGVKVIF